MTHNPPLQAPAAGQTVAQRPQWLGSVAGPLLDACIRPCESRGVSMHVLILTTFRATHCLQHHGEPADPSQQDGHAQGRTRRTIPMTQTLFEALKALSVVRTGFVLCDEDGAQMTDNQARFALDSIYARAGLPARGWHILRHSFGTHAALFGVNPWRLQAWMGHKSIEETMLFVHVAEDHRRPIPTVVLEAPGAETDPDRRILAMLGAREAALPEDRHWHTGGTKKDTAQ